MEDTKSSAKLPSTTTSRLAFIRRDGLTQQTMSEKKEVSLDEETKQAIKWVRELLANPDEFERWANETLDMSRMRRR